MSDHQSQERRGCKRQLTTLQPEFFLPLKILQFLPFMSTCIEMYGDILHVGKEHLPNIEDMFCIQSMTLKDLQHYLSTGSTIWTSMMKGRQ